MLRIAFSVDDFAPVVGYGKLIDNGPMKYLKLLHEEFGCKFTLFSIPIMNGVGENNWEANLAWSREIQKLDYLEIAQHGLTHKAQRPDWGAQEFANLPPNEADKRIQEGKAIFRRVGIPIKGFKAPGWFITPEMYQILNRDGYLYVADHFVGNKIVKQGNLYKIPYTFTIDKCWHTEYDDYLILHSHISPKDGNLNGFNEEIYNNVRGFLKRVHEKYPEIQYVTFSELIDIQKQDGVIEE